MGKPYCLLLLLCFGFQGCIFDSSDGETGSYTLTADTITVTVYSGGYGSFFLEIVPDSYFSGEVTLSVAANDSLHTVLSGTTLSRKHPLVELTCMPDTSIHEGTYTIDITSLFGEFKQELSLAFEIAPTITCYYPQKKFQACIDWIRQNRPDIGIGEDEWRRTWSYPVPDHEAYRMMIWNYGTDEWDMTVSRPLNLSSPPPYRFYLRKRGEKEPTIVLRRNPEGVFIELAPRFWDGDMIYKGALYDHDSM